MAVFLAKIAPVIDLTGARPSSVRAGLIPCGGVVRPGAASRVLLVGDAAGMVSRSAGGIHTALKHGLAAGNAVADFCAARPRIPWEFVSSYPKFRLKRLLRWGFDRFRRISPSTGCWRRGPYARRPAWCIFITRRI
jgi:flavin-dependent dehydrogenase